jgi:hypothetical protein
MRKITILAALAAAIGLSAVAVGSPAEAAMMKKDEMMMHKMKHHPMCHAMVHGKKQMVMCHTRKDHMMTHKKTHIMK